MPTGRVKDNILLKRKGIVVNRDWQSSFIDNAPGSDQDEPENQFSKNDYNIITGNCENSANENELSCNENNDYNWIEDEDEIPAGVTDIMLTAPDFPNDTE